MARKCYITGLGTVSVITVLILSATKKWKANTKS